MHIRQRKLTSLFQPPHEQGVHLITPGFGVAVDSSGAQTRIEHGKDLMCPLHIRTDLFHVATEHLEHLGCLRAQGPDFRLNRRHAPEIGRPSDPHAFEA